jgi:hypothetical protein
MARVPLDVTWLTDFWRNYSRKVGEEYVERYSKTKDYDLMICPGPWWGNLLGAGAYFLFLNPTPDWVWWNTAPDVVRYNLTLDSVRFPQLLDYNLPGHKRWMTFFRHLGMNGVELSKKVCVVNLFPWASYHFNDHEKVFGNPFTLRLVDVVRELSMDESKLFVVCRRPKVWDLEEAENVFVFPPIMRRGVHLKQKGLDLTPRILEYIKNIV